VVHVAVVRWAGFGELAKAIKIYPILLFVPENGKQLGNLVICGI
jgi:hypothetical protein